MITLTQEQKILLIRLMDDDDYKASVVKTWKNLILEVPELRQHVEIYRSREHGMKYKPTLKL